MGAKALVDVGRFYAIGDSRSEVRHGEGSAYELRPELADDGRGTLLLMASAEALRSRRRTPRPGPA